MYISVKLSELTIDILARHNVKVLGNGPRSIVFAHGYGCDQAMWRFIAPTFQNDYRVVLFDLMGAGGSDTRDYSTSRYSNLRTYAEDVIEIAKKLECRDAVFVGHSVSAMIGVLASNMKPSLFSELVLVGPSPRYVNDENYIGGFEQSDIDDLLAALSSNYLGWSSAMAPLIMGNSDRPELGEELTNSFCMMNPAIAKNFARATFLSDNREDLKKVSARCAVLQCTDDLIAPLAVGDYVHRNLRNSELFVLKATGHCPNLSAPEETIQVIRKFLGPTANR